MKKFTRLNARSGFLALDNIDTDMLIPKQYLKTIKRSGLGRYLFSDLRYDSEGKQIKSFVLNQHADIKILLSGENFGCGSSREHAVWALLDFGICVIIAESFADIFYNNCFKNGVLPIALNKDMIKDLAKADQLEIDLKAQTVINKGKVFSFEIEPYRKETLLEGLDDITKILGHRGEIVEFEKHYFKKFPWLGQNG